MHDMRIEPKNRTFQCGEMTAEGKMNKFLNNEVYKWLENMVLGCQIPENA